jgi:methyl-accepting chemotaxis protein
MNSEIPWTKTIASKLSAVFLLLVVISVAVAWTNQHFLSRIKGDSAAINQLGQGRTRASEMLLLSYKIANASGELRTTAITRLREVIELTDHRTQVFIQGDPTTGVLPASDDRILSQLRDRDQVWRTDVKPLLQQIINVPAETDARNTLALIELQVPKFAKELDDSVSSYQGISEEKVGQFESVQYVFVAIVIGVLGTLFWLARGIARRVLALIVVARRIGSNNFSQEAPVEGNDEIALLASTFNTMTANLRERMEAERVARARIEQLLKTIGETASNLASASSELLGGTTQQSASAQEQAAAVAQTVTTVDEVKQTTEQAAQRAKAVAESAQRAAEIGKIGRQAIDESVDAMANVKEQKSRTSHHFCLMGFKRHHSQSRQRTFT